MAFDVGWENGSPPGAFVCRQTSSTDVDCIDATPPICSIVPQSGCSGGEVCTLGGGSGTTLMCDFPGTTGAGGTCGSSEECIGGFLCIDVGGGAGQCTRACRVSMGMADCGGTLPCSSVGVHDLGVCLAAP